MLWPWCVYMTILFLCIYEIVVVNENVIVIIKGMVLIKWLLCRKWVIHSRWGWLLLFFCEFVLSIVVVIFIIIISQLRHKKLLQIIQKLMDNILFSFERELINLINLLKTTHPLHTMTLYPLLISIVLYHLQPFQILKRTH